MDNTVKMIGDLIEDIGCFVCSGFAQIEYIKVAMHLPQSRQNQICRESRLS
jgi:hypothetical protein